MTEAETCAVSKGYVLPSLALIAILCQPNLAEAAPRFSALECGGRDTSIDDAVVDTRGANEARIDELRRADGLLKEASRICSKTPYLPGCFKLLSVTANAYGLASRAFPSGASNRPYVMQMRKQLADVERTVGRQSIRVIAHHTCREDPGAPSSAKLLTLCQSLMVEEVAHMAAWEPRSDDLRPTFLKKAPPDNEASPERQQISRFYAAVSGNPSNNDAPPGIDSLLDSIVTFAPPVPAANKCNPTDTSMFCPEGRIRETWKSKCASAQFYMDPFGAWHFNETAAAPSTVCVDTTTGALDRPSLVGVIFDRERISVPIFPGERTQITDAAKGNKLVPVSYTRSPVFHLELYAEPRGAALRFLAIHTKTITKEDDSQAFEAQSATFTAAVEGLNSKKRTSSAVNELARRLDGSATLRRSLDELGLLISKEKDESAASKKVTEQLTTAQDVVIDITVDAASADARIKNALQEFLPKFMDTSDAGVQLKVGHVRQIWEGIKSLSGALVKYADGLAREDQAKIDELTKAIQRRQSALCRLASAPALLSAHDVVLNHHNVITFDYDRGWRARASRERFDEKWPVIVLLQQVPLLSAVRVELDGRGVTQVTEPVLGVPRSPSTSAGASSIRLSESARAVFDSDVAFTGRAFFPGDRAIALGRLPGGNSYKLAVCESTDWACSVAAPSTRLIGEYNVDVAGQRYLGARVGLAMNWGIYDDIEKVPVKDLELPQTSMLRRRPGSQNGEFSVPLLLALYPFSLDEGALRLGRRTGEPPAMTFGLVAGVDVLKVVSDQRLILGTSIDVHGFGLTLAGTIQRVSVGQGPDSGFVPSSYSIPRSAEWKPGVMLGISADAAVFTVVFGKLFSDKLPTIGGGS
ncbi:hypothetical protein WMF18_21920 [Sorangium sp. So ce315]|uniref:hypothetical protein n=1 Tax=Sorangium sp. So ce315 TaxID=3133299 RepID=UPI003F5E34F8